MTNQIYTEHNIIKMTDSYKVSHWKQYPAGTSHVHSYFESRGGRFPEVTFFGLQYFLKHYLSGVQVTKAKIDEAETYFAKHFGSSNLFNKSGWLHILHEHGGVLPVIIRAVAEGTTVPVSNVLMTIENTDPECYWLTNYLETLLVQVWYPSTICTNSRMSRKVILGYLAETGDPSLINFKLHDFGYRGSTSVESAGLGGAAHLVNFMGTDTLAAVDVAADYYSEEMAGFSIPAAEHSTITSWGREHEPDAYANMLEQYPKGLVAVVSDSYDIYNACRNIWGKTLRDRVLRRDGITVIRPDSGNPHEVLPQVFSVLAEAFGSSLNNKGYKVLDPHIRVIQGDGIDYETMGSILETLKAERWSADNIAFGSGGGLLQKVNRDSQKFAFKCSTICINGIWHDVYKDPVTDHGKRSKAGKLALIHSADGLFKTVRREDAMLPDQLQTVFKNGALLIDQKFAEIRQRAQTF